MENLGGRIREIRRQRRETLAAVAERSGLTRGFLSKLEHGQTSISVSALLRLCAALETDLSDILVWSPTRLVRVADREVVYFGGRDLTEYLLTPGVEQRLQVHLTDIEPGGGSGDEPYELPVEVEFVHVLSGRIRLEIETESYELDPGDSLTFSSAPHSFTNIGDITAQVMWVLAPAVGRDQRQEPPKR